MMASPSPGARDAAERALGVGAAADERAVAHAPGQLAGRAAGGGGRRDGAGAIEGDRADRARLSSACEPPALLLGDELGGIAERARRARGRARARRAPTKKRVAAVLEDAPGQRDRVAHARDGGHGAVAGAGRLP